MVDDASETVKHRKERQTVYFFYENRLRDPPHGIAVP